MIGRLARSLGRWRDPDGDRRSKSFRTKVEASRFLTQVEASKAEGSYIDPGRGKMTIEEWAAEFRRLRGRKRPIEREEVSLRAHVLPAFGKRAIGSIRRSDVQEYVDRLAATLAPSTVRREYGFLHVFFQEAVDMDPPIIARNPCRKIDLPESEAEDQRFFTPEEVRTLYDAFHPRFRIMVLVGCFAGLRIGEQAGLREADVLVGAHQIHVRQGAFEPASGAVVLGPLKTRYSRGRVDIPEFLVHELAEYLKRHPAVREGPGKGLVFASPLGEPLRPRNWRRRFWEPAVEAAGLDGATPHAMRHTFVSFLIDQGLPVEKVAEQARHRDPGFTWRVYRHRFEDRVAAGLSEPARALQNVWVASGSGGRSGGQMGDARPFRVVPGTASSGSDTP